MNKYEELMYKKEQDKILSKGVLALVILIVIVVTFIFTTVKGFSISPDVVKDTVSKGFSAGEPYPPVNGMVDHDNGWVVVSANANNIEDGMIKLKMTYNKLGKKLTTKKVDKVMVSVYEYSGLDWGITNPYKTGDLLFTSNIWIKDLKSVKWNDIKTYEEFKEKANIQ